MKTSRNVLAVALLAAFASPVLAQLGPCLATDPPFLLEGPISAVTASGLAGTITSLGVLATVPDWASVSTPTAQLDMPLFADPEPFPGRYDDEPWNRTPTRGFLGATVIATGCVKLAPPEGGNHVYLAEQVTSDVNENVLLGVVTARPQVSGEGAISLGVMGTRVELLRDHRMPADPLANTFGLPIRPDESVPVGASAAVEGYYGQDAVLHAFRVEVGGGALVDEQNPQISIQRFRCDGDLLVQGGLYLGAASNGSCTFDRTRYAMRLFDTDAEVDQQIAFDSRNTRLLAVQQAVAPDQAFCSYRLSLTPAACPANVRIELLEAGKRVAWAATSPDGAPPNTAPVAVGEAYTTPKDVALSVAAPGVLGNDQDPDGDALSARLVSGPASGTLQFGTAGGLGEGAFIYTPGAAFRGSDSFTYQAVDSRGATSNTVTVTIEVGEQRAPVAVNDSASLPHRTTLVNSEVTINVLANDTDADGDALSVASVTQSANGSVAIVGNAIRFIPNVSFLGTTTFTYTARDALGAVSNPAMVTVTTTNDPPTAVDDSATTPADTPVTINVLANDTDPERDGLTTVNLTQPATGGSVALSGQQVVFVPAAGFSGQTSFTYQARDSFEAISKPATVTVTVAAAAAVVDLDITALRVPTSVQLRQNKPIEISLSVRNNGRVDQPRDATITGSQNGILVYSRTVPVSAPVGATATIAFPSFLPTRTGQISWIATITDDDPDQDVARVTTAVR